MNNIDKIKKVHPFRTTRELFDYVREVMLDYRGIPSRYYKDPFSSKPCPIGVCIPDELYDPHMEGKEFNREFVEEYNLPFTERQVNMLNDIVFMVFATSSADEWDNEFKRIEELYFGENE